MRDLASGTLVGAHHNVQGLWNSGSDLCAFAALLVPLGLHVDLLVSKRDLSPAM